jgi:hypothetical protein
MSPLEELQVQRELKQIVLGMSQPLFSQPSTHLVQNMSSQHLPPAIPPLTASTCSYAAIKPPPPALPALTRAPAPPAMRPLSSELWPTPAPTSLNGRWCWSPARPMMASCPPYKSSPRSYSARWPRCMKRKVVHVTGKKRSGVFAEDDWERETTRRR